MTRLQQQPEPFTNQSRARSGKRPRILTIIAGLVLVAASLELFAQGAPPRNLRIVTPSPDPTPSTGVIAPADFTYLGAMRIPAKLAWSVGALAGRTIGTQVFFFMVDRNGEAFEFPYVGHSLDLAQAPTAPMQREWGFISWNGTEMRNLSWDYSTGAVRSYYTTGNPWPFFGLAYYDNKLYWSYLDYYNTMYGATDHCLGFTDLAGDPTRNWARGPFRFRNSNVKHLCGNVLNTPRGLGLVGSMMAMSRNTDNSWGPSLFVRPYPTTADPGGYSSPELTVTALLDHSIQDRSPRVGDYKPDPYNQYNPDIHPSGGNGFWTQRDRMNVAAWIETTGGKRGILFMGGMATGYVWYGNFAYGPNGTSNPCRSAERGENAEAFRPEWRIYDPNDLTGSNLRVPPRTTLNPKTLRNGDQAHFACEQYVTGAYFDRASGKLFLAGGYDPWVQGLTVINVWQLAP
jgi:hypothetical protein